MVHIRIIIHCLEHLVHLGGFRNVVQNKSWSYKNSDLHGELVIIISARKVSNAKH